jgi:hypothetical protein
VIRRDDELDCGIDHGSDGFDWSPLIRANPSDPRYPWSILVS